MVDIAKIATLTLKLIDGITGPANRANAALRSMRNTANSLGNTKLNTAGNHLQRAMEGQARAMQSMKASIAATAVVATGFVAAMAGPIKAMKEFQTTLEDIRQKADLPAEAMRTMAAGMRAASREVNQSAQTMATAMDTLVGLGLDPNVAAKMLNPMARAATAYRADMTDMAKAGQSVVGNLKVPPNQMGKALDVMAQSGKEGAFEVRDMAQYMPQLAAAFEALGQKGIPALADLTAALQVARKGTGDSSSAANNVINLLSKIQSPETTKNFDEVGIDIRKEIKSGVAKGRSPIDIILEQVRKATKGDMAKIGDLFADMQVQAALRPLLANQDEYHRIRKSAEGASGVVDKDFDSRITTTQAKLDRFWNSIQELGIVIGDKLAPAFDGLLDRMTPVINAITDFVNGMDPNLVGGIAVAAGGLITLAGAVTTLRIALAAAGMLGMRGAAAGLATGTAATGAMRYGKSFLKGGTLFGGLAMLPWGDMLSDREKDKRAGIGSSDIAPGSSPARRAGAEWLDSFRTGQRTTYWEKGDVPAGISIPAIEETTKKVTDLKGYFGDLNQTVVKPQVDSSALDAVIYKLNQIKAGIQSLSQTRVVVKPVYADVGTGEGSGW